ncbi:hypothetical protein R1sor_010413 [Riccia sorocarpa]|uniref:Uncharacterized protein n=1 Tax=Riccia sorocarpa TaxID=122646 RepID=A0ABD3I0Q9_9MARC
MTRRSQRMKRMRNGGHGYFAASHGAKSASEVTPCSEPVLEDAAVEDEPNSSEADPEFYPESGSPQYSPAPYSPQYEVGQSSCEYTIGSPRNDLVPDSPKYEVGERSPEYTPGFPGINQFEVPNSPGYNPEL